MQKVVLHLVKKCIRCYLEGSGRLDQLVSSSTFWKYSRRFLDMIPEGS